MARGIDNYFLILELDFAKPESNADIINQRIQEKAKFWNANSDKGRMQQKYRQYKSQVPDIGKVMSTEALRKVEAKDAMAYVQGVLKDELKFFAGKKEIEEPAAKTIMEKCGLWPEMFEKLTGLKIVKEIKNASGEVENPIPEPTKARKFKGYIPDLNILHKSNLYDFLADGSAADIIGLQTLDGEELIKGYSNPLKEKVKYGRTEEDVSTKSLCAACEEVFDPKNAGLRSEYDKYLIWQKRDAVANRMDRYSGTNKTLDEQQQRLFTDELTQIERDREKAVKLFQDICAYKGIKASGRISDDKRLECGYCHAMVDISHGETKCSECGRDLYIKCPNPKCGKKVPASSKACGHCGFVLENVQKAETLCEMAKTAIANMDFDKARGYLARAEQLFHKYEKIKILEEQLASQESVFSKEAAQLNSLVVKKAFYKAAEVLKSLQRKAPTAKIANSVLIETAVREAERLYKAAVNETSEEKLIDICSQITSVCADYPGVEALLVKYRPKPPSDLKIASDSAAATNTLTWNESPSTGEIYYKIVRKENTVAVSIEDSAAEVIGNAGIPKFVDTKLRPGVNYYYSVYAIRAGVSSSPIYGNAVNIAKIKIIRKEEGDGFVEIAWESLEKNARVDVYRQENQVPDKVGAGEKIRSENTYFRDDTVENGKKYFYLLAVTYQVDGRKFVAETVAGPLIPMAMPEPIDDLTVNSIEDDLFEARWSCSGKERVMLYCTDKRLPLQYGDVVSVSKVTERMKPVDSSSHTSGSCRFRIHDNKRYLIVPVIIKNNMAVIGEGVAAAKIEKVHVEATELINADLRINIKWPEDAIQILIIYGTDQYSKNLEDRKGKTVKSISRRQYEADTGLYLRNIEKKDYYITMYSACKINGSMTYSDGTNVFFSNRPKADIKYSIRTKGFMNKQIEIEFTSSMSPFRLPEIDLVSKQGGVPVYITSGMVVEHIDEQTVEGSYKVTFPANLIPRNSYLKAFFTDENINDEISLRPVYGTNFKVN